MRRLGDDLVLLSIEPDNGLIGTVGEIRFGLMGAELIQLLARGNVILESGHITPRDPAPSGDAELDQALSSLTGAKRPPSLTEWIGGARYGILDAYLARLAAAGTISSQRRHLVTHWTVTDPGRLAQARAALDEIAASTGQVTAEQAAFGGLAHSIRLQRWLYSDGIDGPKRQRLKEIGRAQWASDGRSGGLAFESAVYDVIRAVLLAAERANP